VALSHEKQRLSKKGENGGKILKNAPLDGQGGVDKLKVPKQP
jgi:hypothetical protein